MIKSIPLTNMRYRNGWLKVLSSTGCGGGFLIWSNNIKMEESIMTDKRQHPGGKACL